MPDHLIIVLSSRSFIESVAYSLTFLDNGSLPNTTEKKFTKQDVPRLPREVTPLAAFVPVREVDQRGSLFQGPGAKRETGKYKIRPVDDQNIKLAKKFAMEQSVKFVMLKQQQQQQRTQIEILKKQQALLLMCRTYIGSINFELNEAALKQAFQPFGPVKSVSLTFDAVTNRHKGFAFLEYETPEAAQLAIEQMNGVILGGRNIKVGRPSNMPQAQPIIDRLTEEAKNYNRIYVSSIHPDLSEKEIQSVFEAFGAITSCVLAKDTTTGKHKGYAFIEYETVEAAKEAISSMNLFDLGGQHLRVGKAITPPDGLYATVAAPTDQLPTAAALAAARITAQLQATEIQPISQPVVTTPSLVNNHFSSIPYSIAAPSMIVPQLYQPAVVPSIPVVAPVIPPVQVPISPILSVPTAVTVPQPTILEEPPIPVGLREELQPEQNRASISLVLPTPTSKADLKENKKTISDSAITDDTAATLSQQEELSVKGREQRHLLMQKLNQRRLESRVCVLRNMVGPEDVDDTLEQEITDECSRYGPVNKVIIYTEKQGEDETGQEIVKIFVEFANSKGAEKSVETLNGRWFAGRMVKAELYDQNAYEAEDFSG